MEYLDEKNLNLKVMASHSNLRSIVDQKRNLPDDIAKEIIAREGLIGLVFYNHFLGSPENLPKMIEYGLQLGGEKSLAFGADFFCTEDGNFPSLPGGGFFEDLSNASCYPSIIKKLSLSPSILEGICAKNSERFLLDTQQQHSECH